MTGACHPLLPALETVYGMDGSSCGWPQANPPLQMYGLRHDEGNKSDLDVICIEVITVAEEMDRIHKGECEGK